MTSIAETIKAEEGWRPHVYDDSRGIKTIGYGFVVDPERNGDGLPKEVADFWLDFLIEKLDKELRVRWKPYSSQPKDIQAAIVEMAYQLGVDGVLGFTFMLRALEQGDRVTAAYNMLQSRWHGQTAARCERVAMLIRGDGLPEGSANA